MSVHHRSEDILDTMQHQFCTLADKELTKNDLQVLMSILSPAVRKWKHIGAQIRLDPNILDDIETTPGLITLGPEAFLEESIMWWLRKHSTEPPTVQVLLRALRSPAVQEEAIALQVEQHFLVPTLSG